MPVSLFEHKPQRCPFGHSLWPGQARVGWKPCICAAAQEGAERGRGMGHLLVSCQTCHAELCEATFYEPPHDVRCRQAGPWLCLSGLLARTLGHAEAGHLDPVPLSRRAGQPAGRRIGAES
jgi:hypothetical protein